MGTIEEIADIMREKRTLVVTGAGMSTDAGLPDYRGQGTTEEPSVDYDMFVRDAVWQRWVWQRNHETWQIMAALTPTPGHVALAQLERAGFISGVATQNIDGLDAAAGIRHLWELHGTYRTVRCLDCDAVIARDEYDKLEQKLNPGWPRLDLGVAILASANRRDAEASTFRVAPCPRCGGLVKPSVVFFGEGLPADAMDGAMAAASEAEAVLVVGTSLLVSTGMWVVRQAWAHGAPVMIINRGPTAGDSIASVRVEAGASESLSQIAALLEAGA